MADCRRCAQRVGLAPFPTPPWSGGRLPVLGGACVDCPVGPASLRAQGRGGCGAPPPSPFSTLARVALLRDAVEFAHSLPVGLGFAFDRSRELGVGPRQRGLRDALERFAGDVFVGPGQDAPAPLARREYELVCVVLGGEDDQCASVELAGGLGGIDVLPEARLGVVGFGVGGLGLAGLAALEGGRLGSAQVVEDESEAVGGQGAGDVVAGAEVVGPVGPEQPVGELCGLRAYADAPPATARWKAAPSMEPPRSATCSWRIGGRVRRRGLRSCAQVSRPHGRCSISGMTETGMPCQRRPGRLGRHGNCETYRTVPIGGAPSKLASGTGSA